MFLALVALLQLVHHAIEIGISSAKASGEPVSATLGNCFAIGNHLKLTCFTRRNHSFNAKPLFDRSRETRNLGFIVLSSRAGTYFNLHCVLQTLDATTATSLMLAHSLIYLVQAILA